VAVLPQSLKRQAHGKVSKATNPKVSAFSPMTCWDAPIDGKIPKSPNFWGLEDANFWMGGKI
jgi:hypothetical protein